MAEEGGVPEPDCGLPAGPPFAGPRLIWRHGPEDRKGTARRARLQQRFAGAALRLPRRASARFTDHPSSQRKRTSGGLACSPVLSLFVAAWPSQAFAIRKEKIP